MPPIGQQSHSHFVFEFPTYFVEESDLRTWVDEYVAPVRYKIDIFDPTGTGNPLLSFDPFLSDVNDNPFVLTDVDITSAPGQTGTFTFKVDDSEEDAIDIRTIHNGCVVRIQGGKDPDHYKNRAYGIVYRMRPFRPATNILEWQFEGNGFGNILNYTLLDFIKSARRVEPGSTQPDPNDPAMTISNLIKELFTKRDVLVSNNGYSLAESYDLDISEIEGRITEILPGITLPRTLAAAVLEQLMTASGGIFQIDANKKIKAHYPSHEHSGIIIKDFVLDTDRAETISYPMNQWEADYSIVPGEFANEVVLDVSISQETPVSESSDVKSFESLAGKDLMVQFIPGSPRLANLGLMLSKTGTGHDSVDDAAGKTGVEGIIVTDDGFDMPSNNVIATLNIPYEDITDVRSVIFKLHMNFETDNIMPGQKHWLILRRSGSTEEDTVQWYHDNDGNTVSTTLTPRRIGIKNPPTLGPLTQYRTLPFHQGWAKSNDGPVFQYSFFTNAQVTLFMQNPESVARYTPKRPIQALLFAPWITDSVSGLLYMSSVLAAISREKRVFTMNEVTIPNKQFEAGKLCYVNDTLLKLNNQLVEIAGVHESATASNLFEPLGRSTCDVSLIQRLDPLSFEEDDEIIAPCSIGA